MKTDEGKNTVALLAPAIIPGTENRSVQQIPAT